MGGEKREARGRGKKGGEGERGGRGEGGEEARRRGGDGEGDIPTRNNVDVNMQRMVRPVSALGHV